MLASNTAAVAVENTRMLPFFDEYALPYASSPKSLDGGWKRQAESSSTPRRQKVEQACMGPMLRSEEGIDILIHSISWIRNLETTEFYAITVIIHSLPFSLCCNNKSCRRPIAE
jgi:hypothetical protein